MNAMSWNPKTQSMTNYHKFQNPSRRRIVMTYMTTIRRPIRPPVQSYRLPQAGRTVRADHQDDPLWKFSILLRSFSLDLHLM